MREAIGTQTIFKLALAFTLIFAAFLSLAIVYNKVFKLKNETLTILEKYEGATDKSLSIINNYLKNSGYNTKGKCDVGSYGVPDLNDTKVIKIVNNDKNDYYYCIEYYCDKTNCIIGNSKNIFYKIRLYFKFDLPIFGELFKFKINGETKGIQLYSSNQKL